MNFGQGLQFVYMHILAPGAIFFYIVDEQFFHRCGIDAGTEAGVALDLGLDTIP